MPTRTRTISSQEGQYEYRGAISSASGVKPGPSANHIIQDTGLWNKPFTVNHYWFEGPRMTKDHYLNAPQTRWKKVKDFTPSFFQSHAIPHLSDSSRPVNAALSTELLAKLNPNTPLVDLPVAIAELRELPQLIREEGARSIRNFAKGNLTFQFGVMPIVSDLVKLVKFGKEFERRYAELSKLREKGGYSKKVGLWSGSVQSRPLTVQTTNSSPSSFFCKHTLEMVCTSRRVWGYGQILPDRDFSLRQVDDRVLKLWTRRAILGGSLSLATAWNALPWSWLVDWFSDIGTFLDANRGGIPHRISGDALCETIRTEALYVLESSNFGFIKGEHSMVLVRETKSRLPSSGAFPSFQLPFLTGRQVGILGSLGLTRYR